MKAEYSHNEIYDRLIAVESKVDKVSQDTTEVVAAFHAAQGAFTVLDWIARAAKPIIWIAGIATTIALMISDYRK